MPWTVQLENIDGTKASEYAVCPSDLLPLENCAFPILGYVDPDNDTVFSSVQMIPFLREWSLIRRRATELGQMDSWTFVHALALRCKGEIDLYLRFVGG